MSSLGVRRLDAPQKKGRGPAGARTARKGKGSGKPAPAPRRELTAYEKALAEQQAKDARAAKQKQAARKPPAAKPAADKPAADKPAADKPAAKPAADRPAAAKPVPSKPAAAKPAAGKPAADELARLKAELALARASAEQAAALSDERDRLRAALDDRARAADDALARAERAERALARASGDAVGGPVPAPEALDGLGIRGPLEADKLLAAVAEARLGGDLLATLSVDDAGALSRFLDERILRLGGCAACPDPGGRVRVEVPPARCELCAGDDLQAARRRFMDGTLVNGISRLAIVGGSAKLHRILRELLADRRLDVVFVPGALRKDAQVAAAEVADVQAVLRWQRADAPDWLLPDVAALYDDVEPPVRDVDAPHLAAFLVAAGAALDALVA